MAVLLTGVRKSMIYQLFVLIIGAERIRQVRTGFAGILAISSLQNIRNSRSSSGENDSVRLERETDLFGRNTSRQIQHSVRVS